MDNKITNIPTDYLNQTTKNYIDAIESAFGCSRDYAVTICLAMAGISGGKKIKLVSNPFVNYPNDYFCLVGGPSWNKTAPLKEISQPLREWDKTNFQEYKRNKRKWEKESKDEVNSEPPIYHQKIIGDSSSESRNAILAQGDSAIIIADELRTLIDSLGRYSKGGDGLGAEMSLLLSIWSNANLAINRKSEETKLVDEPVMSILGGIQPGILRKTLGKDSFLESGFTHRFLFVFPEKAVFIPRENRLFLTEEIRDSWRNTLNRILQMEPMKMQLSLEANKLYIAYADGNDIQADEEDEYIASVRKKMNIHVLRLALMANLLSEHWQEPLINESCMEYAIRVANHYFQTHIERVYPLLLGKESTVPKKPTKEQVITEIGQTFDIKNKSILAEALGYDRAKLTNILNGKLQ